MSSHEFSMLRTCVVPSTTAVSLLHSNPFTYEESVELCEALLAAKKFAASQIDTETMRWVAQDTSVACRTALARVSANPYQAILEADRRLNARIRIVDMKARSRRLSENINDRKGFDHPAKLLIQADEALRHYQHQGKELGKLDARARMNMRHAEDALIEAESHWNQKKRQREDADEEPDSQDEADADENLRVGFIGRKRPFDDDETNAARPARRRKIASDELRGSFDVPDRTLGRRSSKGRRVKRTKHDG